MVKLQQKQITALIGALHMRRHHAQVSQDAHAPRRVFEYVLNRFFRIVRHRDRRYFNITNSKFRVTLDLNDGSGSL